MPISTLWENHCTVRQERPDIEISASNHWNQSVQLSSIAQSCPTLCDLRGCNTPDFPVHHQLPETAQTHVHPSQWCHPAVSSSVIPFSSCLQVFPRIGIFSNESALWIRWPKYWSFSFNISPSSEHPGLISFRMDWLDILAVTTSKAH